MQLFELPLQDVRCLFFVGGFVTLEVGVCQDSEDSLVVILFVQQALLMQTFYDLL